MTAATSNLENRVHDYHDTHSAEALDDIVAMVDGLVLRVVYHMLRSYQGVVDVDFDDLYQMGMMGVIRAMGSLPEDFDENEIRMRVVAYVKSEIRSQFKSSRRNLAYKCSIMNRVSFVSDAPMHLHVEVKELFNVLIKEHVMSREEFYFLYHRFVEEMPVRELSVMYGKPIACIHKWEQQILQRLRRDRRVRSFFDAEL